MGANRLFAFPLIRVYRRQSCSIHSPDGKLVGTAQIEEGKYTCIDAPVGDVVITVLVPKRPDYIPPDGMEMPKEMKAPPGVETGGVKIPKTMDPRKIMPIPEAYSKREKSGLNF